MNDASATIRTSSTGIMFDAIRLRWQLAIRGLLQDELARLAGVTPSTVSKAVHGGPISPVTFLRLVKALSAVPIPEIPGGVEILLANPPGLQQQAARAHLASTTEGDGHCGRNRT
ncbi:MAG TPA: helix-turn-helix transcriptional regulator [Candidatus Saccharimonadales bacterium]|nr:helix-turn-helix transcriptional regulator [Candidatus Saccharimonadales bacterium]